MKKSSLFAVAFLTITALGVLDANATTTATTSIDQNALVVVMCNTLDLITGGTGKTLAAFAVIVLGIGFFLGKLNWGIMLATALGIAALFGAPTIVNAIAGADFNCDDVTRDVDLTL